MYGSPGWMAAHAADGLTSKPSLKERSPTPVKPSIAELEKKRSLPSNAEIVILDSDDEDEGRVKRELSPSYDRGVKGAFSRANGSHASMSSGPPRSQTVDSDVIDLTLDSDDEAPQVPPTRKKRTRPDDPETLSPTEPIWKKSRVGSAAPIPAPAPPSRSSFPTDPASFGVPRQSHPPAPGPPSPSAHRYDNPYHPPSSYLPHPLPGRPSPSIPTGSAHFSSAYTSRPNGTDPAVWRR